MDLVDEVRQAVNILGPGQCSCPGCEGCQYERAEAQTILLVALARAEGKECSECHGQRYVDPAPGSAYDMDICPTCQGNGCKSDFKPFEWWPDPEQKQE